MPDPHIAGRDTEEQARRGALSASAPRCERWRKSDSSKLAHGALHAEQQAIIGMPRIIDTVLVDDDGPDKSTETRSA